MLAIQNRVAAVLASCWMLGGVTTAADPLVRVWYGNTQFFGSLGHPQRYVNILGRAHGATSLRYSLNGGPETPLSLGPDGVRLSRQGDFNVDLATQDLLNGANTLELVAVGPDSTTHQVVDFSYDANTTWPLPYAVDWAQLVDDEEIQTVAQVVDGRWTLVGETVRTAEPGYDRLIAVGDSTWTDYEVTVPFQMHSTTSDMGVGLVFRWNGHTDEPISCEQPKCGWEPLGSILWYRTGRLEIYGNWGIKLDRQPRSLTAGTLYWLKARVQTDSQGSWYRAKVWADVDPEPAAWDLTGEQPTFSDPGHGSFMLVAHQADISFGSVTAALPPSNMPPVCFDDHVYVLPQGNIAVEVLGNDFDPDGAIDPATLVVVEPPLFGQVSVDPIGGALIYTHTGGGVADWLTYAVADDQGAVSNLGTLAVTVIDDFGLIVQSDDFNRCTVDEGRWDEVHPQGVTSIQTSGTGTGDAVLEMSLPVGELHDAWGPAGSNGAARLVQVAGDADFEMEVKWQNEPEDDLNDHGLFVEEDAANWLRFDLYHNGSSLVAFIGVTLDSVHADSLNAPIPSGARFLQVQRTGDLWEMRTSTDGVAWTLRGDIVQPLTVRRAGVFAANPGGAAFTSIVDYFENTARPIEDEDGAPNAVSVVIDGQGTVQRTPDQQVYACGDVIQIAATPAQGWVFERWTGDLQSYENPDYFAVSGPMDIVAIFALETTAIEPPSRQPEAPVVAHLAFPNPFHASTQIRFDAARGDVFQVRVFDVAGRAVRSLAPGGRWFTAGSHTLAWDGRSGAGGLVAPGVYFYEVRSASGVARGRLLRLR